MPKEFVLNSKNSTEVLDVYERVGHVVRRVPKSYLVILISVLNQYRTD